jgi:hypothetical protein
MAEDPHVSRTISMPRSLAVEMDDRAKRLGLTRTDYVRLLIVADLHKGGNLKIDLPEVSLQEVDTKRKSAARNKHVPAPRVKKVKAAA